MIGEAQKQSAGPRRLYSGSFYRFTQISTEHPWLDRVKLQKADASDMERVSIPPYLSPNLQMIPYAFDLEFHRLFVASASAAGAMSPNAVVRLLEDLVSTERIEQRFGRVAINVATRRKDVEELLKWRQLRQIRIEITRPNATDFDDEAEVLSRMERIHASSETLIYAKSPTAVTLEPDEIIKKQAAVAASNGEVVVHGIRDRGGRVETASSKQFPWHRRETFSRKLQTLAQAFRSAVDAIGRNLP
jgi:hypothetical protein